MSRTPLRATLVMRRLLVVAHLVALSTACDSSNDPVAPGTPGGSIPSIGGTYSSASMWRFELTPESGSAGRLLDCAGTLTVASQLADTFVGTFFVQDTNCGSVAGSVTAGTLRNDGSVTFALNYPAGTDGNFLTAAFSCTYISGDTVMHGTLIGTNLQAQSTTVMDCPNSGGRSTLNVRINGSR